MKFRRAKDLMQIAGAPLQVNAASLPTGTREAVAFEASGLVEVTAAEEDDGSKMPTFTIAAYNGGPLQVGYGAPVYMDLAGGTAPAGNLPILYEHSRRDVIGYADDIQIGPDAVQLAGKFTSRSGSAGLVAEHARGGFTWRASIGASVSRMERVDAGAKVTVNGREVTGPAYIARQWRLRETSVVSVPADETATATIAARQEVQEMDEFRQWLAAAGFDHDTLTEQQITRLRAAFDAEQDDQDDQDAGVTAADPTTVVADHVAQMRIEAAAEARRQGEVRRIARDHPGIAARAIEAGWDADRTELEVLRHGRDTSTAPTVIASGRTPMTAEAVEASLCLTAGVPEAAIRADFEAQGVNADAALNLVDMRRRGGSMRIQSAMIAAAALEGTDLSRFEAGSDAFISAAMASHSVSTLMSNTARRVLLSAYTRVRTQYQSFSRIGNVPDFREVAGIQIVSDGMFDTVTNGGELKETALQESAYKNQADTKGTVVSLSRKMIVNDDIGAFAQMLGILGRNAAARVNRDAFAVLMGNANNFFAAGAGNLLTGAANALTLSDVGPINAAIAAFRNLKQADGHPTYYDMATLLVPSALEGTANIITANGVGVTTAGTSTTAKNAGIVGPAGMYSNLNAVASPELQNSLLTGNSATAWYIVADTAQAAPVSVVFLNGQQMPTIESVQTPAHFLGMQWRSFLDYGVALEDPKAAVKVTGSG